MAMAATAAIVHLPKFMLSLPSCGPIRTARLERPRAPCRHQFTGWTIEASLLRGHIRINDKPQGTSPMAGHGHAPHEQAEHAEHHGASNKQIALLISILALLLAIS